MTKSKCIQLLTLWLAQLRQQDFKKQVSFLIRCNRLSLLMSKIPTSIAIDISLPQCKKSSRTQLRSLILSRVDKPELMEVDLFCIKPIQDRICYNRRRWRLSIRRWLQCQMCNKIKEHKDMELKIKKQKKVKCRNHQEKA